MRNSRERRSRRRRRRPSSSGMEKGKLEGKDGGLILVCSGRKASVRVVTVVSLRSRVSTVSTHHHL